MFEDLSDRRCTFSRSIQHEIIAGNGARVKLLPRRAYDAHYVADTAIIGFAFETQSGTHAFASSRRSSFKTRPNSLAYVSRGCDVASTSTIGGEYLTVALPTDDCPNLPAERRFNDFVSPAAIGVAQVLRAALLSGGRIDSLTLECCIVNLHAIAAGILSGSTVGPPAQRWMTDRRLKLVDEIIEEHMEDALTVGQIAATLGLSQGFFNRAFKAAVGKTPHDYIVDRRVSRARELMLGSTQGLAGIAATCGFASHAHMTTQFRRRLGITPSRLRENQLC